jgi:arylsulfatase A
MNRRSFIQTLGLGAAGLALPACRTFPKPPEPVRPNMVVVLCDDLGYGDLGCYGHPHIRTPRLDQFATEGVRLTDCYAAAPVCSPARVGMLTGRTPHRAGVVDWIPENSPMHLRADETTVANLLRDAGYATCHVGKWHCNGAFNSPNQPQPDVHGFDHWFSTQNNARPTHENPINFARNGEEVGALSGFSSELIVDEAIQWLSTGWDQEAPFCLFVWFHSPHEPVASAPEFVAQYPDADNMDQQHYFANVTQIDHAFGRLMDELDSLALRDNTLVHFTSDNGPETLNRYRGAFRSYGRPDPMRAMKLHLYEGGIRVPGLTRYPGHVEAGTESHTAVCGTDILPTLCAAAEVSLSEGRVLDGANALPGYQGRPVLRRRPLYWRYNRALSKPYTVAMRHDDWKLLADENLRQFELYNLIEDPGETTDRTEDAPRVLEKLTKFLRPLHEEIAAEGAARAFS